MRETAVILLVEDQVDDILLMQRAFERAYLKNPVQVVRSGEEAMAYLYGTGKFSNRAEYPLPILVLLDLKLPCTDGYQVLSWIRQQNGIRGLPVVVLTSSSDRADVAKAYRLGANSYFVKEVDFNNSVEFARLLGRYWLVEARTPDAYREDPKTA
jgi:CheY-like chemotaxis protein